MTILSVCSCVIMAWECDNEDLDQMERGFSQEVLRDELYIPVHKSRGWIRCFVSTDSSSGFRMFLEGSKRFLLSAKKFDDNSFLISLNEDFPFLSRRPTSGFVASLVRQSDSSYHICLRGCRLCDNRLGHYTCGRGVGQREVIAKILHYTKRFRLANTEMRCLTVNVPHVSHTGTRAIWCPRSLRIENPSLPMSAEVSEAIAQKPHLRTKFVSKLAEWSTELGCLVLKFPGNRVLCASSKNFLLQEEVTEGSKEGMYILQFGRSSPSKYVLDFQYPLSPLQAFGIAMSTFAFDSEVKGSRGRSDSSNRSLSTESTKLDSDTTSPYARVDRSVTRVST